MITMMKDLKAEVIAKTPALYEAAKQSEYGHQTINYGVFAKARQKSI